MKLYLAASYRRRREMSSHATKLEAAGVEIMSRWVYDEADLEDDAFEAATDPRERIAIGLVHALTDLSAIRKATHFALFTEPTIGKHTWIDSDKARAVARGGRHVETGFALQTNKTILIVGGVENVFHCLPGVVRLKDFRALLDYCKKKHPPK